VQQYRTPPSLDIFLIQVAFRLRTAAAPLHHSSFPPILYLTSLCALQSHAGVRRAGLRGAEGRDIPGKWGRRRSIPGTVRCPSALLKEFVYCTPGTRQPNIKDIQQQGLMPDLCSRTKGIQSCASGPSPRPWLAGWRCVAPQSAAWP
jgi:hypothetical protein